MDRMQHLENDLQTYNSALIRDVRQTVTSLFALQRIDDMLHSSLPLFASTKKAPTIFIQPLILGHFCKFLKDNTAKF